MILVFLVRVIMKESFSDYKNIYEAWLINNLQKKDSVLLACLFL